MASSERLELPTVRLEGACSIQLSYVDIGNCLIIIAESPDDFKPFMKKAEHGLPCAVQNQKCRFSDSGSSKNTICALTCSGVSVSSA